MRRNLIVLTVLIMVGAMVFSACVPDLSVEIEQPTATEAAVESGSLSGQLQLAGSTTVQPLAEVLADRTFPGAAKLLNRFCWLCCPCTLSTPGPSWQGLPLSVSCILLEKNIHGFRA